MFVAISPLYLTPIFSHIQTNLSPFQTQTTTIPEELAGNGNWFLNKLYQTRHSSTLPPPPAPSPFFFFFKSRCLAQIPSHNFSAFFIFYFLHFRSENGFAFVVSENARYSSCYYQKHLISCNLCSCRFDLSGEIPPPLGCSIIYEYSHLKFNTFLFYNEIFSALQNMSDFIFWNEECRFPNLFPQI